MAGEGVQEGGVWQPRRPGHPRSSGNGCGCDCGGGQRDRRGQVVEDFDGGDE